MNSDVNDRSPVTRMDRDGVAVLSIDNPPVNALSQALREALLAHIHAIGKDDLIEAVVIEGAGDKFIAGADIREFDGPLLEPSLPDLLEAIEQSPKPVIAAVVGFALGGGAELAFACHYRCATPDAKFGLPEVKLGIIPGAGGIPRLTRLAGPEVAMDLVASGRAVDGRIAVSLGLIDTLLDPENRCDQAVAFAKTKIGLPIRRTSETPIPDCSHQALDISAERWLKRARGQRSIGVAVEVVRQSAALPFAEAASLSRKSFLELRRSSQAAALRYLFFAERDAQNIPDTNMKAAVRVGSVAIIGAGMMGRGIATACLLGGYKTILVDSNEDVLARALQTVRESLDKVIRNEKRDAADADKAMALLSTGNSLGAIGQSDLIIEAVFEDFDVKRDVIRELDRTARADAIICTNTSYLDIDRLAAETTHPERIIGLHFFAPAEIMKLVEVIRGAKSGDLALATGLRFARTLGKISVVARVCDGFIVNRILAAYRLEMEYALEDGAFPQDVDLALERFGMAMGPFSVSDLSGLDIAWARRKRLAAGRDPATRYVKIADQLCEMGRLGRKTGQGWYSYTDGKRTPDPVVNNLVIAASRDRAITRRDISEKEIVARALTAMTREARQLLDERIALRASDIDLAIVNGLGFPAWRGGPLYFDEHAADFD